MSDEFDKNDQSTEEALKGEVAATEDSKDEYEKVCFLCRRPESVAGQMIDLPNNIQYLHGVHAEKL